MAGVAGLVAVGAILLAAFTSTRLAEPSRIAVEARPTGVNPAPIAAPAPPVAPPPVEPTAAPAEDPAGAPNDPDRLRRRSQAFAALVRSRTPELALIVGHGPDAHARAVAMREALRGAGVTVRWCRLKPAAELGRQSPQGGLAVYADPKGPDAAPLVGALQAVGFPAVLMAAHRAEVGLPSPSIYFATDQAPEAADLQTCDPVVRTGATAH